MAAASGVVASWYRGAGLAQPMLRVATYKGDITGFFAQAGIGVPDYGVREAEFVGGNLITEALAGGDIDLGGMSEIPPLFALRLAAAFRLIAVQRADVRASQVVLLPKDSPIRHVAELRGRRVGYARATTSHYLLLRLLREQGLGIDDVVSRPLRINDGFAAFQAGELDAWVTYGIGIQVARARLGARVLATGLGYLSGNYLFAARAGALADTRLHAAIADYLGRVDRAWRWRNRHPREWAAGMARLTGVEAERFLEWFHEENEHGQLVRVDEAAIASLQGVADVFHADGVLPQAVDVRPLWATDFSF
ncbi:MAG: ABC transporter substrate-binding protein [Pseudomonas sp.]